jgi:hypothetical protein
VPLPEDVQASLGQAGQSLCGAISGHCNAEHDLSASDYFDRVKHLADNLAATGVPLRDDEVVAYLLTSLPEEYDSLLTSVTTRAVPMSLSEVYTNLLSFEMRLINHEGAPSPPSSAMANYASRGGYGGRHGGRNGGRGGGHNGGRTGFLASGGTAHPLPDMWPH